MVKYRRLTEGERYQIEALLSSGRSIRSIASQLRRSPSSVSREVKRAPSKKFSAKRAELRSKALRHQSNLKNRKAKGEAEKYIREKILLDWSPEQIAGRMKFEQRKDKVSLHTIYRYLERDKRLDGELWKHLRFLRKGNYYKRVPKGQRLRRIQDRIMIEKRPKVVEKRTRLGDYERDTVLGKFNGSVLLSIVDRCSMRLHLSILEKKCCVLAHKATVRQLKNSHVRTITNDNGGEFTRHKETAKKLKAKIYFARPYHSWERGTNENINGLLRQYFPRKTDIGRVPGKKIRYIESLLNNRPRKTFGFKTPIEVEKSRRRRVLRWV
jgi:IS30 family transposase